MHKWGKCTKFVGRIGAQCYIHIGIVMHIFECVKCVFLNTPKAFSYDVHTGLSLANPGAGLVGNVKAGQILWILLQAFSIPASFQYVKNLLLYNSGWAQTVIIINLQTVGISVNEKGSPPYVNIKWESLIG